MSMSESGQYDLLDQLAEEFAARFRRGERPALKEYIDRYPDLADEIRDLFPAMVRVEQAEGLRPGEEEGPDWNPRAANPPPRQIGDYRILRQIGRGGMGVVYEAEQISLGRRVALKVLPGPVSGDRMVQERFRREARAAARLHHTNIVPVYEVGQDGDVRFYAMQFIQGLGLDAVITELRRLRDRSRIGSAAEGPSPRPDGEHLRRGIDTSTLADRVEVRAVLQFILTGRFDASSQSPEPVESPSSMRAPTLAGSLATPAETLGATAAYGEAPMGEQPLAPASASTTSTASSSAILPGGTLLSSVESGRRGFFRSLAQIGRQVAGGLAYAHARGIVHRDIKPSNLLLDTEGVVWIADFGLAKGEDEGLTQSGDILGTIRYMAPERFRGEGDARADVYALGLTLYELLTLQPGFDSSGHLTLIDRIKTEEAPRPRSVDSRIPRDLETIVLKAIEKDPKARYQTAEAMGEDLGRFLADEPIRARQVGTVERYWRWAGRNKLIASLVGVLAALMIATTVGSMVAATHFQSLAGSEFRANQKSQEAEKVALEERDHSRRQSAGLALDRGMALAEQGEAPRGLHWMLQSLDSAPAEAAEIRKVIRINLSAWSEQVHGLRHIIRVPIRVESSSLRGAAYRCAFSPDGRLIAAASADRLEYWDATSLQPTGTTLAFEHFPWAFAFSPDGKTLITGHERGGAQRWDVATGRRIGDPLPHGGAVRGVAFSPDGKTLLTGCADGTVRFWDSGTGEPLGAAVAIGQMVTAVAFHPDGKSILIGTGPDGRIGSAYLRDVATRANLGSPLTHQDSVLSLAFNPDGSTVLTGSQDGTVRLWDSATHRPLGEPLWHRRGVYSALFTPDGAAILTGAREDQSAFLWEAATGRRIGTPLWHQDVLDCLAVSPDGRTVLSGGMDETARLWEIGRNRSRPLDPSRRTKRAADQSPQDEPRLPFYLLKKTIVYSPDRQTVLTSDGGRIARLWETSTGRPLGAPLRHSRNVRTVAFSPDGKRVATASHEIGSGFLDSFLSAIQIWDAASGRPVAPPIWQFQWVSALAFSPDGRVIASGDYGQAVRLRDAVTGEPVAAPLPQGGVVFSVAFSPDGRTLAVGTVDPAKEARLWDLATGRPIGVAMPHKDWVVEVAFSPDGRALLTRSHDFTVRLWDARNGEPLTDYLRHKGVPTAALSPDGRRLATGGELEDQARIWDARTGRPLPGATLSQADAVTALAFSPDGELLGVGCKDGSARLWDVATARPLGPPLVQRSAIVAVTFARDGSALLTTAADGTSRSWPVPSPMEGDRDRIALRLEILTGLRMEAGQDAERLSADAWDERRRRLTSLEGSVAGAYASSLGESAYHEARARDAEQDGDTFAATWHLDRLISARPSGAAAGGPPDLWLLHARRARARSIAGRLDLAAADYARAEQVASRGPILDWYRHRVADCELAAQWRTALWYLDRCLAAQPGNWEHYVSRARVYGRLGRPDRRLADLNTAADLGADGELLASLADEYADLGQFSRASALYARARRRGPLPLPAWGRNALVCLELGDRAGYRAVCRALLDGHPKVDTPQEAEFIAKTCSLGPDATDDLEPLIALARYAVEHSAPFERPVARCTLGAFLYRAGRAPDALVLLNEAIAAKQGRRSARDLLFLGMAHHRLGHAADARRCFIEASRPISTLPADERPVAWSDRVEYQILLREAEAVIIDDPNFPTDPFTPNRGAAAGPIGVSRETYLVRP